MFSCFVLFCLFLVIFNMYIFQLEEFVISEEMSRVKLCEITDGGHFFVHDAEGGSLSQIEAKLQELKLKVLC